jgi:hypothetical protein
VKEITKFVSYPPTSRERNTYLRNLSGSPEISENAELKSAWQDFFSDEKLDRNSNRHYLTESKMDLLRELISDGTLPKLLEKSRFGFKMQDWVAKVISEVLYTPVWDSGSTTKHRVDLLKVLKENLAEFESESSGDVFARALMDQVNSAEKETVSMWTFLLQQDHDLYGGIPMLRHIRWALSGCRTRNAFEASVQLISKATSSSRPEATEALKEFVEHCKRGLFRHGTNYNELRHELMKRKLIKSDGWGGYSAWTDDSNDSDSDGYYVVSKVCSSVESVSV